MLDDENSPTPASEAAPRNPGSVEPAVEQAPEEALEEAAGENGEVSAEVLPGADPAEADAVTEDATTAEEDVEDDEDDEDDQDDATGRVPAAPMVLFQAPETKPLPARRKRRAAQSDSDSGSDADGDSDSTSLDQDTDEAPTGNRGGRKGGGGQAKGKAKQPAEDSDAEPESESGPDSGDDEGDEEGGARRRRRRGGRRRRKGDSGGDGGDSGEKDDADSDDEESGDDNGDGTGEGDAGSRRRRRRRRPGDDEPGSDDPDNTVTKVRKERNPEDEITGVTGSTRLEAKKQRRREGREAGRRRAPIVSEAEFLARREAVDRVMVIRQKDDLTQIGVLEDRVLVEHYVARESQTSLIGNVYLGRVQNVLPSMEAAFIDIGKGRNAVLYAGEVNWSALGHPEGQPRKIESVLSSGQTVLVQVTKDPVGHKGARLTGQISLPGRFLVYVPDGNTSGISRKLPDTERNRLKSLLKEIVPDSAGVIVRTAAEGASEEELTRDVERLTARWQDIESKVKSGKAPQLLYGEPDLTLKVVRDLFTEDFAKLVVQGDDAWDLVDNYVSHVAPDLRERLERFEPAEEGPDAGKDLFAAYRVDEQIAKGLDRKVWLPSGGSLIIDRTEAMTVVDVNTGKFTGSGGNLEETVTKNNLEAAEEIVRQLRLRDIGGIIVIDFIDMVLESNRDLVLRRLVECLGRDRTRHQVAEVTSLGLVQMTRKRIGTGLLEAFSTDCEHCKGRGLIVHDHPVEQQRPEDEQRGRRGRGGRNRGGRSGGGSGNGSGNGSGTPSVPSPADLAASRPPEKASDNEPGEKEAVENPPDENAPDESPSAATPAAEAESPEPKQPERAPDERAPDVQPEETEPPTSPKVTTTTRRRGARRAAGPPAGGSLSSAAGASVGVAGSAAAPSAEPFDVPVEPAVPGHTPGGATAESAPDDVRGEAATEAHDAEASEETGPTEETDESGAASLVHVPVKKKGSRKR